MYKPASMTDSEWVHLLGADANNLEHMKLTYAIGRDFLSRCEPGQFTAEEMEDIQLACIMHDWAEAIVSDIPFFKKDDDMEAREQEALMQIVDELFPGDQNSEISARLTRVLHETIFDRTTPTGSAFNAIERCGYIRACLLADKKVPADAGEVRTNITWLTSNVLGNQIRPLLEFAPQFRPVDELLRYNAQQITTFFENTPLTINDIYDEADRATALRRYEAAAMAWHASQYAVHQLL